MVNNPQKKPIIKAYGLITHKSNQIEFKSKSNQMEMKVQQILTPEGRETEWGFDVYNMNLADINGTFSTLEIMNVISWESTKIRMTKEELRGFANFINSHIDD